jgi:hypothetical protein
LTLSRQVERTAQTRGSADRALLRSRAHRLKNVCP